MFAWHLCVSVFYSVKWKWCYLGFWWAINKTKWACCLCLMASRPFYPMALTVPCSLGPQGQSGLANHSIASSRTLLGPDRMDGAMTRTKQSETFMRFGVWSLGEGVPLPFMSYAIRTWAWGCPWPFLSLRTEAAWKISQHTEGKRPERGRAREPENIIETLGPVCLRPTHPWLSWLLKSPELPTAPARLSWFPGTCNRRALTHTVHKVQTLGTEEAPNHWQLFLVPLTIKKIKWELSNM